MCKTGLIGQTTFFPERVYLRRIDPESNMRHYYLVYIDRDLFGTWCLVREWGRVGSGGRHLREEHANCGAALDALDHWVRVKKRRGYVEVNL